MIFMLSSIDESFTSANINCASAGYVMNKNVSNVSDRNDGTKLLDQHLSMKMLPIPENG